MNVEQRDGYVLVYRRSVLICAAIALDGRRLRDIEFTEERHRANNRTRQAAMRALQKAGWR